jgi:hypothetical protein
MCARMDYVNMGRKSVICFALVARFFSPLLSAAISVAPAVTGNYARLPLAFEKHGERFVAHGRGYIVGIESGRAVIEVLSEKEQASHPISLEFAGSRSSHGIPGAELPGKVNYILGNDPAKWQTGLPTYRRLTWPDIYPGIDVVYYGNQRQLEFDFVVKPGANPNAIKMRIAGGARLTIDASGAIKIDGTDGLHIPLSRNLPGDWWEKEIHIRPLYAFPRRSIVPHRWVRPRQRPCHRSGDRLFNAAGRWQDQHRSRHLWFRDSC